MTLRTYDSILVDCSNIFARASYVGRDLSVQTPEGELNTGGIYGSLRMIDKLRSTYLKPGGVMHFLFDNTSSVEYRRRDLDPEYKANRFKRDPSYYKGLDYLHLILVNYSDSYVCWKSPGSEADDIVSVVLRTQKPDTTSLLVSMDFDWSRSMGDSADWLAGDVLYTRESFKTKWGFYPSRKKVCLYKAFRGDPSDNIPPGVKGLRSEVLLKLVNEFDDLPSIWAAVPSLPYVSDTWKKNILEAKARTRLNYSLVDFVEVDERLLADARTQGEFRPKTLLAFYRALGFSVSGLDPRVLPFMEKPKSSEDSFFDFEDYARSPG